MGDWGLKVSQQGYDVKTAADKEMLLHSSFKYLNIYMEGTFTSVASGGTIATHSLTYAPIFFVLGTVDSVSKFLPTFLEAGTIVNSARSTTTTLTNRHTSSLSGYYYIFQEQLNQNYSVVEIQPTATSQGTQVADYGVKASKASNDIKTAAVKDLIMTSGRKAASEQAKLHIIHSITTGTLAGSPYLNEVTHSLGYVPQVWWFADIGNPGGWQMIGNADDSSIGITTTKTGMTLPYSGNYSCIIFKDPAF